MKMASRMTTTRAEDTEGMAEEGKMAGMDMGMADTGSSSSITTTATTMNDIKTKKICGEKSTSDAGALHRQRGHSIGTRMRTSTAPPPLHAATIKCWPRPGHGREASRNKNFCYLSSHICMSKEFSQRRMVGCRCWIGRGFSFRISKHSFYTVLLHNTYIHTYLYTPPPDDDDISPGGRLRILANDCCTWFIFLVVCPV